MRFITMRKITLIFLLGTLLLTGCNLPTSPMITPTGDAVATQVSQLLTQAPTQAILPVTATVQPGATLQPSPTVATATPTHTLVPTSAQPSPTPPPGDPKNSLGTPTWHDALDSGKSFYQYENDNTKVTLDNGALALTGVQSNGWLGWSLTFSHKAQNAYIEAVFTTQTCSGADMYGLVFRIPDSADKGYFFGVTCEGKYNLHARDFTNNTDTTLIESTANSAILAGSGQTNRVGVMANGNQLRLYVNGELLKEITDSTYLDAGNFGALIAANATPGFTVRMEEISQWVLP